MISFLFVAEGYDSMIVVDGSYHEGGGQIARTAVGLAALLSKDVRVVNIRANRPKPGLSFQHVCAINAVCDMCSGQTRGVFVGSDTVEFCCRKGWEANDVKVKIPTAGSMGLVLQPLIIAAMGLHGKVRIDIDGGASFGKWAPALTYIQNVFCRAISRFGYDVKVDILRHGFYPKGGGLAHVEIAGRKPKSTVLDCFSKRAHISGVSVASRDLACNNVASRQAESASETLEDAGVFGDVSIDERYVDSVSCGSGVVLWTDRDMFLGACSVGERGKRAEAVGEEAASQLICEYRSKASVDKYLCDQLIPFIGVLGGMVKTSEITKHAETNMWVVEKFREAAFNVNRDDKIIGVIDK